MILHSFFVVIETLPAGSGGGIQGRKGGREGGREEGRERGRGNEEGREGEGEKEEQGKKEVLVRSDRCEEGRGTKYIYTLEEGEAGEWTCSHHAAPSASQK